MWVIYSGIGLRCSLKHVWHFLLLPSMTKHDFRKTLQFPFYVLVRFCENHALSYLGKVENVNFFCNTLHQKVVQLLYFSKPNSQWILRIPVRQSFSLVSALSVTCLSAAQNSVSNASPGNVIKNSWCERTGWLKVAQSDNYAWRNTFKRSAYFRCWSVEPSTAE